MCCVQTSNSIGADLHCISSSVRACHRDTECLPVCKGLSALQLWPHSCAQAATLLVEDMNQGRVTLVWGCGRLGRNG